jgi:hypothetical protein
VLGWEEAVLGRPRDQRGLVPARELRRRVERVGGVEPTEHAAHVAADLAARQHGQHVGVLGIRLDRAVREPAEGEREPSQRPEPQRAERDRNGARHLRRGQRDPEQAGWEVLERVARREHDRPDPVGPARGGDLRERAAGVVADQGHVAEVERLERVDDQVRQRGRPQVGALRHRLDVRAERQVERHALEAIEPWDDLAPQVRVHEHAVDEHHHGPLTGHVGAHAAAAAQLQHLGRAQLVCPPARPIGHSRTSIQVVCP